MFSFVLALMSKPMVVTLPVILILLDYWPLNRLQSRGLVINIPEVMSVSANKGKKKNKLKKEALKNNISPPRVQKLSEPKIAGIIPVWQLWEKIPFFILSSVLTISILYAPNEQRVKYFPLDARIKNALVSFVIYLKNTFMPYDMTVFYPFPDQIQAWKVLFASLLILVISAVVIAMVKRKPYLFVGWLWYTITILPVIGIIQISAYAMADRYTYLPSIGIAIMLAWSIPLLFPREDMRKKILFPSGIAALAILAVLAWQQCGYWKNSITLSNHALQITKDNYVAHTSLGAALFSEGKIEEANDHYNKAISIMPDYFVPYNNRGIAYVKLGQYQLAIGDSNKAIRLKPDYADAYSNRGVAYLLQGNKILGCLDAQKACELGNCKILEIAKRKGDCR